MGSGKPEHHSARPPPVSHEKGSALGVEAGGSRQAKDLSHTNSQRPQLKAGLGGKDKKFGEEGADMIALDEEEQTHVSRHLFTHTISADTLRICGPLHDAQPLPGMVQALP